ncbi:hypothetical protein EP073_10375 [Geovibrio thiophilus]|uniref:Molecular chaperone TorD n=1 Tax=Geovibrio thiophilus TaxID=139438 RepID=A0A3R6AYZ9_9BACT|nr:molecular chaperone TorD family protein [Geovibrio thiophilus]QAR33795.1 hypothetical protein EP073_10375 [Geovibrio thiophilus]
MNVNEVCETHKGRDVTFNIFSRVFNDVPDDFSDKLAADTCAYLVSVAEASENGDLKKGAQILNTLLPADKSNLESWFAENRLDRAKDFTFLFVLGQGSVSSYESVYRSPERLIKQEPWSEVKAAYALNGFKKADSNKTIEDHVSLELQFMGLLSKKAAELLQNEDFDGAEIKLKAQKDFYNNHIIKWVPDFCDKVISKSERLHTQFYVAYAYLLKGFLTEDMLFLEDLLGG